MLSKSYHKKRTSAEDSEGGKTVYHFSRRRRLERKERRKDSEFYSRESFFWREKSHAHSVKRDEGNLITRGVGQKEWRPYTVTTYAYDKRGNVLKEIIAGHLTGYKRPDIFEIDAWSRPFLEGRECYGRSYTYTDDGFNLPLSMEEDDGLKTTWTYLKDTNKPLTRFLHADGKVVGREFFAYNEWGLLIERINDDGSSFEREDLTEVSKRIITRVEPNIIAGTPGIGKPLKTTESFWDIKAGREQVLKIIEYVYGIYDLVISESHSGPSGEHLYTLSYEYDEVGNKVKETDPEERTTVFGYSSANQCIYKEMVGSGLATYYTYDSRGRLIKEEKLYETGDTFTHTYRYDSLDRKTAEIDPYGGCTTFTYDSLGRLIQITHPSFMGKEGMITPIEKKKYNIWDQVEKEVDAAGFVTKKSYSARGQITEIIYPDGSIEKCRYNLNGTLEKKEYPNGSYTLLSYDGLKHPIREETYDAQGVLLRLRQYVYKGDNLISETDPAGNLTTYQYDGAGRRVAKIVHGDGREVKEEYAYDALGKLYLAKKWYGEGLSDYIAYFQFHDKLGRLTEERTEDSAGLVSNRKTYAYDLNGNCIEEANYQEENRAAVSRTQYASYNLPLVSTNPLGVETRYIYDFFHVNGYGQQVIKTTVISPNGVQTVIVKDPAGRDASVCKISPIGQLLFSESSYYEARGLKELQVVDVVAGGKKLREYWVAWAHDERGRPIKIQEDPLGKNKCTRISYNEMGQIQSKTKPDGILLTYAYDPLAREISCLSSDGKWGYTYEYDLCDHLIQSKDLEGKALSRRHDDFGNLILETLPNGLSVSYAYDGLNRLKEMILPDGSKNIYEYSAIRLYSITRQTAEDSYTHYYQTCDWQGKSLQSTLITGDVVDFSWDLANRVRSINSPYCSEIVPDEGYDLMGNLVQVEMSLPGVQKIERYSYDLLNQLTREDSIEEHEYANDSLYNRLEQDECKYQINSLNQVEKVGEKAFNYDLNGNIENEQEGCLYEFDAFNRLIACEKGDWKEEYAYDSFGRRLTTERFKNGELEAVFYFLYQGLYEIGRIDQEGNMKEFRVMGKQEGSFFRVAVAVELSGRVYAPLYDHRFNVIALVEKDTKDVVEVYRYAAFGKVEIRDPSGEVRERTLVDNPWLFANQRRDDDSGLYCIGRRYYNVELGRWISPDPGDFVDGMNLYTYTHNRPLVCLDYFGFSSKSIFGKGWLGSLFRGVLELIGKVSYDSQRGFNVHGSQLGVIYSGVGVGQSYGSKSSIFSSCYSSGYTEGDEFPAACVLVVTGIACESTDTEAQAEVISKYLNDHRAYYFCHETVNIPFDIGVSLAELLGRKKDAIDGLASNIEGHFKRMELATGRKDVRMYVLAQSRGGIETNAATDKLDPEIRRRIVVRTFGSGNFVPPKDFISAENIVNDDDVVARLAQGMNNIKGIGRKMEMTLSLMGGAIQNKSFEYTREKIARATPIVRRTGYSSFSPFSFIEDHYFRSKGYDDELKNICGTIFDREIHR